MHLNTHLVQMKQTLHSLFSLFVLGEKKLSGQEGNSQDMTDLKGSLYISLFFYSSILFSFSLSAVFIGIIKRVDHFSLAQFLLDQVQ